MQPAMTLLSNIIFFIKLKFSDLWLFESVAFAVGKDESDRSNDIFNNFVIDFTILCFKWAYRIAAIKGPSINRHRRSPGIRTPVLQHQITQITASHRSSWPHRTSILPWCRSPPTGRWKFQVSRSHCSVFFAKFYAIFFNEIRYLLVFYENSKKNSLDFVTMIRHVSYTF